MPARTWPYRLLAAALILGTALLRIVYLASDCPLDLSPDEAHYWDWSRHLDWSYYSKGPLVAWLIRLSCEVFGSWSVALTGTEMLAVRLPAVTCGSLLLVSLYILTLQVFRRERLALAVVAMSLTLPLFAAGSSLMTIDSPYTCCWGWALVFGYGAAFRDSRWCWLGVGLAVGAGMLAKYTMVLWLPSFGLFLLATPSHRHLLLCSGYWLATTVAAVCCVPILVWNLQHDWVTLRHASGHAGLQEPDGIRWLGPLAYVGIQFAMLMGFWFVVWARAMFTHRPWSDRRPEIAYLWWMAAPMFAFFLAFSFKNGGGEPNWPVTAYLSGMVLAAGWLAQELRSPVAWYRRFAMVCTCLTSLAGVGLGLVIHNTTLAQPLLLRFASTTSDFPLRRVDPTCRLKGWKTLAAEVDRLRAELRAQGIEPVVAADVWTIPGELGFYCEDHPPVYCLAHALGNRHSQYDLWTPNPLSCPQDFSGRTFIVVGGGDPLREAFTYLEPPHIITHFVQGQPVAQWWVYVAHGYRGFGNLAMKNPTY